MNTEEILELTKESREYEAWKLIFATYTDLYAGGATFKAQAGKYLYRRHREPGEIYAERANRAFYENYIGSIIDWFASTLFRREIIITFDEATKTTSNQYRRFLQDCDRSGTSISQFFRRRFTESLIYGVSYICFEFPKQSKFYLNRLEETTAGGDRPFLVGYTPLDVLNKIYDENGLLEGISILLNSKTVSEQSNEKCRKYLVYDRRNYYIVERTTHDGQENHRIVEQGPHSCSDLAIVPVFELALSEGMWLMNKAASLQLEHFNKSNSLAWSLGMALYATPVIYSKKDWSKMLGESYYIHLDPEDKFGWTEPEGNVYKIAMDNLNRLQEEIYRTCYLMNQSKSWMGSQSNASASSKKRDYQITQEVLQAYGDVVKDCVKKVLYATLLARKDKVHTTVTGLDEFEVGEFKEELDEAKTLLELGIDSKTFKQQLFKRLAFKLLGDLNENAKSKISAEIDQSVVCE